MSTPRNYRKEYARDHKSSTAKKNRAARNKARAESSCKKGDGKEVDHIKPLPKGGSNAKSNRRVVSRSANRKKGSK